MEQSRRLESVPKGRPTITALTPSTPSPRIESKKSERIKPFSKISAPEIVQTVNSPDPGSDYEYYEDDDPLANVSKKS